MILEIELPGVQKRLAVGLSMRIAEGRVKEVGRGGVEAAAEAKAKLNAK